MMSLVIFGLYFVGRYVLDITSPQQGLYVPDLSMWMAGASAIFSGILVVFSRKKTSYWLGLTAYLTVGSTIWILITLTGGIDSPFIALWLMVGVLSGMFGAWVWLLIFLGANINLAYQLLFNATMLNTDSIVRMLLVAEAPTIASFIIWHKEKTQDDKKAYNALAAQLSQVANKSEIVINSIADGVVAVDAQGLIQLINPAAQTLLGWPKQDAIGLDYRSVIKLIGPNGQEVPDELSPVKQVILSNKPATNDTLSLLTKSSKKVLVSVAVTPVGDQARTNGVILVFRDITHEREQERQRAEFISTASHEMRTPVAAMEGYLGLAMNPQTATIDDKARNYLQKAYESTQHLGRLFQDLLTVSKAEDSRLMTRPAIIDITAFTREVVEALAQKAKDKGIGLVFAPGGGGIGLKQLQPQFFVHADPNQLREILNNLVDNAIKYTKQGTVTVNIKGEDPDVVIEVTDTGIGIPPEDVAHLFQKFYRVDNSDTREIGGTGLGLYISRRLTEANGGHIGVTSTYGRGSTFMVRLTRIPNDQAASISTQQAQVAQPATPTGATISTANPAPAITQVNKST